MSGPSWTIVAADVASRRAIIPWTIAVVAGCRGATHDNAAPRPVAVATSSAAVPTTIPGPAPARPEPARLACDPAVPAAACAIRGGLRLCAADDRERIGEWRYAVIA